MRNKRLINSRKNIVDDYDSDESMRPYRSEPQPKNGGIVCLAIDYTKHKGKLDVFIEFLVA